MKVKGSEALILMMIFFGCQTKSDVLFSEVSSKAGITFFNELTYTEEFNPYTYRNFYNGAGVALGDVNNDGLLDVYFTGNIVDNKLFLNKGNWEFEDITESAQVACPGVWSSGATFADVNGDGWLDLYVCKSGKPEGENRHNELFINNGDLTFTEKSKEYGLDVLGLSTHAAFFDYDKDGDLDVYVLTNSIKTIGVGFDLVKDRREIPDPSNGGNKFFRNDDGKYVDITLDAGIYTSDIGFGLGITLGDFNHDSWTDVFISNDFFERDYLYINDKLGGFTESAEEYFKSLSMGSMGADVGDLDNDGKPDLMVTEMLPGTIERKRSKAMFESWDKYQLAVSKGYFHQYPRNALQRNTGEGGFSEVSRLSGLSDTEWSWGALIFDMDNDGLKDIFVSNGIYKDLLDRDYLTFMANDQQVRATLNEKGSVITDLIDMIPSTPISNAAFKNIGQFQFENSSDKWGLGTPSFSNGSAYGDLDNDGDLDLVVNNVNMKSFVYRNETDTAKSRSLRVKLRGEMNTSGVGAKIEAWAGDAFFIRDNYPSRGFQSSVDPVIHLGLGEVVTLDSLKVIWPSGKESFFKDVRTNQTLVVEESEAFNVKQRLELGTNKSWIKPTDFLSNFTHRENNFVDFDRERLLPEMYSNEGPDISVGDLDGDDVPELFFGGAKENAGIVLNSSDGIKELLPPALARDSLSEDVASVIFDANGDGLEDLFVASGGRAFNKTSGAMRDRLYINDGSGQLVKESDRLPRSMNFSSSTVSFADWDNDGDFDLFIGERFHPFYYGQKGGGYILENDGQGYFSDVTNEVASGLTGMGMVTDAKWADIDGDGDSDLVVVGDWMSVRVFKNEDAKLVDRTTEMGLQYSRGWWRSVQVADVDRDGDLDILGGNHGTNSFFISGTKMFLNDFDDNGKVEQIICVPRDRKYYPIADRDELIAQIPSLKKKILYYKDYASMSITDLFSEEKLQECKVFEVDVLASSIFYNEGTQFREMTLPIEAQYAPVYAIEANDLNGDGFVDLIVGGNQYLVKPQFGRYDGLSGLILEGGKDGFSSDRLQFLGIKGQIRDIKFVEILGEKLVVFARNNDKPLIYEVVK